MIRRAWTFNADLAVKGTRFRLMLPMYEPLLITSIRYTPHHYIEIEGDTRQPFYSFVFIDGEGQSHRRASQGEEETGAQTKSKADPELF